MVYPQRQDHIITIRENLQSRESVRNKHYRWEILNSKEDGLRCHLRQHMTSPAKMRWHNSRVLPNFSTISLAPADQVMATGVARLRIWICLEPERIKIAQGNRRDGWTVNIWQLTQFLLPISNFASLTNVLDQRRPYHLLRCSQYRYRSVS